MATALRTLCAERTRAMQPMQRTCMLCNVCIKILEEEGGYIKAGRTVDGRTEFVIHIALSC